MSIGISPAGGVWSAKLRRIRALVRKETYQVLRDPSSIAIGVVLPLILILLFGYGLSLDVKHVPLALVIDDSSADASDLAGAFELSPYFQPRRMRSLPAAQHLLLEQKVDGIVQLQSDFSRRLAAGQAQVQLIVHGADANRARIIESYVQGAVGAWSAQRAAQGLGNETAPVTLKTRIWFNEANDSSYFLVPGLIVLVMTLIGALLTSMVMAREWERGTLEALLVTPVRSDEILLGKTLPYFLLGMVGLGVCVFAA
jgi:ABC-2 type transport system permease protein